MWRISGTKGLCNNVPTVDGPIVEGSLNEKKIITGRKNSSGETGNQSTDEYANRELLMVFADEDDEDVDDSDGD